MGLLLHPIPLPQHNRKDHQVERVIGLFLHLKNVLFIYPKRNMLCFQWRSYAEIYEWLDKNSVLSHCHFEDTEKTMYIYDHFGGEARQEVA